MTDKIFDIPKDAKEEPKNIEEPKKQKVTKAKKVIDDSTRESLVERLKQSRKIREYEKETVDLKNKIIELEKTKEELTNKDKGKEEKPKRVQTPKIKVIDSPVEPKEQIDVVADRFGSVKIPTPIIPERYVYSTFTRPLWK